MTIFEGMRVSWLIVGPALLGIIMLILWWLNRSPSSKDVERTERATRLNYAEEDRAAGDQEGNS
jgi:hypothetical protein